MDASFKPFAIKENSCVRILLLLLVVCDMGTNARANAVGAPPTCAGLELGRYPAHENPIMGAGPQIRDRKPDLRARLGGLAQWKFLGRIGS